MVYTLSVYLINDRNRNRRRSNVFPIREWKIRRQIVELENIDRDTNIWIPSLCIFFFFFNFRTTNKSFIF